MSRVLVISDLHVPYHNPNALNFVQEVAEKWDIDTVVCIGDEVDFHGISFHRHDPDLMNPGEELRVAVEELQRWYTVFPDVHVCTSNHTSLPFRKAFDCGLPKALLRDYREFLQAPKGWQWADEWTIDNVTYIHGENLGSSLTALKNAVTKRRISTVIGHLHSEMGIYFSATERDLVFAMNVGCLVSIDSMAFAYGKKFALRPVLGCGVVIDGTPYLEQMDLGSKVKRLKKSRKVLI